MSQSGYRATASQEDEKKSAAAAPPRMGSNMPSGLGLTCSQPVPDIPHDAEAEAGVAASGRRLSPSPLAT